PAPGRAPGRARARAGELLPCPRADVPPLQPRRLRVKLRAREIDGVTAEVEALLLQRAERVRHKPAEADDETLLWVAEFPVGEETYALPLETLRAAVPLKMVTAVPLSPPHVIGILRFQGQIVTALSLASLLGGRGWREDPAVLLVVDPGFGRL